MVQSYNLAVDYYKLLGVDKIASAGDIRRAYYHHAKQLHPDKNGGDAKKAEQFKAVLEAYEILKDAIIRQKYDWERQIYGWNFRYQRPSDHEEENNAQEESKESSKDQSPRKPRTKRSKKSKAKAAEEFAEDNQVPPEFRERERSTYSYTYPSPQSSTDQDDSSKSSKSGQPDAEPEESDDTKEPCRHYKFKNYYNNDYSERPFLPKVRLNKHQALRAWRLAKNQAADAKFALDFFDDGEDVEQLCSIWEDRKRVVRELWQEQISAESRCAEHERRAKVVKSEEQRDRRGRRKG